MAYNFMQVLFQELELYSLSAGVTITDKELGRGSYATVLELDYLGLKCAGKKIHELLIKQEENSMIYAVRRFKDECQILSQVRHPNIVQFLGVFFQQGDHIPILVTEFLPLNIDQCLNRYNVPVERRYSILHDVALGLNYLHNQYPPIIHRDLSSNNVLLTSNMGAKISDLGVARILNLSPQKVTYLTKAPGTPAFMPPEAMIADPKYDTSIDIFSYGILMIHILSGQIPVPQIESIRTEGDRLIPVSEAERRESFLEVIGNDHPLMDLILKCIHNNPEMRATTGEIVDRLACMVEQYPISSTNQLDMIEYVGQLEDQTERLERENYEYINSQTSENTRKMREAISKLEKEQEGAQTELQTLQHTMEKAIDDLKASLTDEVQKVLASRVQSTTQDLDKLREELKRVESSATSCRSSAPRQQRMYENMRLTSQIKKMVSNEYTVQSGSEPKVHKRSSSTSIIQERLGVKSQPSLRRPKSLIDSTPTGSKFGRQNTQMALKKTIDECKANQQFSASDYLDISPQDELSHKLSTKESMATSDDLLYPIYTAKLDYEATSPSELSFKRGQQMHIKGKGKGKMWLASLNGEEGNVPKSHITALDDEKWFFGKLDAPTAKKFVMTSSNQLGSFLVRQNKETGIFSVTIRDQDKPRQYHIHKQENGMLYISRQHMFRSISDLVQYHSKTASGLCSTLAKPCIVPHCIADRAEVTCKQKVAMGQFSVVWKGEWKDKVVTVNTITTGIETSFDLLDKCTFLKSMEHENHIRLLAVHISSEPFLIITEHLVNGSLSEYLPCKGKDLRLEELINILVQVAAAMQYLEEQNCIHHDLAAKNVMIEVSGKETLSIRCKLSIYPYIHKVNTYGAFYKLPSGTIPIRWSPHEAIVNNQVSIKSNVWSFGITMWEIVNYCRSYPYPETSEAGVLEKLKQGYRMPRPLGCPEELYSLMNDCWKGYASNRPTFETLHQRLKDLLSSDNLGYEEVIFN